MRSDRAAVTFLGRSLASHTHGETAMRSRFAASLKTIRTVAETFFTVAGAKRFQASPLELASLRTQASASAFVTSGSGRSASSRR